MMKFDYITCSCAGDGIQICSDKDYKVVYFAMFEVQPSKMPLRERIRRAWLTLIGKIDVFNDQLVLDAPEVQKLIEVLQKTQSE